MAGGRNATQVKVLVDGAPFAAARALRAWRTTGGRELDRAEIEWDLAASGKRLVNWNFYQPAVEIEVVATISGVGDVVLHWGKLSIDAAKIAEGTERIIYTSRTEPFHFGGVIEGQYQLNPLTGGGIQLCPIDLVFNPLIDDKCWPNMYPELLPLTGVAGVSGPIFLDPESVRTPASKAYFGVPPDALLAVIPDSDTLSSGGAEWWSLPLAVLYLCATLNGAALNFKIPTLAELAMLDPSPELLRDFRIPRGFSLPQALDELLTPFGYGFNSIYPAPGQRRLGFFARGLSDFQDTAVLNPPGGVIKGDNAPEIELEYNRGNARNALSVQGDFVHFESTFNLVRAWPEELDDLDPTSDLAKDADNYQNTPSYRDVWRKWVLNEAGDYSGVRPEIGASPYNLSLDAPPSSLSSPGPVIGTQVPRRRKFLPCITQGADLAPIGQVQGCVVEWSPDKGDTWLPLEQLENHTCHLLSRECGLYFDAQHVPQQLYEAGANARVRITATVRADDRIVGEADSTNGPQTDAAPALVDASRRFHFRMLSESSKFYDQVGAGSIPSDEIDDSEAIQDYAEHLLSAWNMADIGGAIKIEGLDRIQYGLTDVLFKIEGREIALNGCKPGGGEIRNPQIVGIEYSLLAGAQYRILKLETYREEAS